jgi:hypothetical protein
MHGGTVFIVSFQALVVVVGHDEDSLSLVRRADFFR